MTEVFYYQNRFLPSGEETPVSIEDRGHQFGDGVYEVVRVYGGRPFLLDDHLNRFDRSLSAIGIDNPLPRAQWLEIIHEAIRRSEEPEAAVYWQVTRGTAPRLHTFPSTAAVLSLSVRPVRAPGQQPERLLAVPDDRWANVFVKSINLLPNVIAKEAARKAGAHEALFVRGGAITEGGGSNAWFVSDGVLFTAPANRYILGGITRDFVLQLAARLGISVHEETVSIDDLGSVDEVFMTSTTHEINAIEVIQTYPGLIPELTQMSDHKPSSLLPASEPLQTLWKSRGQTRVTQRLVTAYSEAVENLRSGGVPLA